MKFYLSSFKVGKETEKLKEMTKGKKIGFVNNALDFVDAKIQAETDQKNMQDLRDLGIEVEILDLRDYFGKTEELKMKVGDLGGVWVRGGNTFVLRQAMRLSEMDKILKNMDREDFFYGGYNAGGCVLSPSFKGLEIVDDATITPYEDKTITWDGLGLINYLFLPHYKSDHHESEDVDKVVQYYEKEGIVYKTLRDGEVIIIE